MSDGPVGSDPLPENVTGEIVEDHQFIHRVNHDVNWSVIGALLFAALLLWFFFSAGDGGEAVEEIQEEAADGEGNGGLAS